jgi:hypothetical protein
MGQKIVVGGRFGVIENISCTGIKRGGRSLLTGGEYDKKGGLFSDRNTRSLWRMNISQLSLLTLVLEA